MKIIASLASITAALAAVSHAETTAAGFIIQMGSAVFPAWELPNWRLRLALAKLTRCSPYLNK